MSNEEIVDELLHEAEGLKIRSEVIDLSKILMEKNPDMDRTEAIQKALNHLKLYI